MGTLIGRSPLLNRIPTGWLDVNLPSNAGLSNRHPGEEDVGISGDAIRSNDERDMSLKQRFGLIQACVDVIIGAAVNVATAGPGSIDV